MGQKLHKLQKLKKYTKKHLMAGKKILPDHKVIYLNNPHSFEKYKNNELFAIEIR